MMKRLTINQLIARVDNGTAETIRRVAAAHKDRQRTECSSCKRPFRWYELKPGDGRCDDCTD